MSVKMGKVLCAVCHKRCKGDILKVEELFIHHKCFQCGKCRKNLQKGGFFIRDDRFYCPEDYQKDFGTKCAACESFVEGEVVTVLGKTFHSQCFQCCKCRHLFVSGERTTIMNGAYYCSTCARSLPNVNGVVNGDPLCQPSKSEVSSRDRRSRTLPILGPTHLSNGMQNGSTLPYVTAQPVIGVSAVPFKGGQLSIQTNQNGYSSGGSDKQKDQVGDTLLSTSPGQTFSGESFTYMVGERRNFPPDIDYGRHYPISYLELAERGLTALMSSEEVPLPAEHARGFFSCSSVVQQKRQSRRDAARLNSRLPTPATKVPDGYDVDASGDAHVDQTKLQTTTYTTPSSLSFTDSHTPVSLTGRPRRDLYVRRRELSPGSGSLSSGVLSDQSRIVRSKTVGSPFTSVDKSRTGSRSVSTTRGKRGMVMLAESLARPRVRPDRSVSPELATESWIEARRLASYPNARIPDAESLPAIERFDFPAPPSPAVVMLEKRREKRLAEQRSATSTLNGSAVSPSGVELPKEQSDRLPAHVSAKMHQLDAEIEALKHIGESSGITAALIQELEASKLVHIRGPELDPISASRSPNANTEPGYKPRYSRHVFASPSRDTRRDRRTAHTLSYRMDYSSTGGRSVTIPSFSSTPRPGYTSGILHGRALSLPRPLINGGGPLDTTHATTSTPAGRFVSAHPIALDARQPDTLTRGQQAPSHAPCDASGDHTLLSDESPIHTASDVVGHMMAGSVATSALSVDGLTACSGDDLTFSPSGGLPYVTKSSTMSGLPHSVTGLRPIGALMKQQALTSRLRSRTHTPLRRMSDYDSDMELDAYPSVQSWLRSTSARKPTSFKTYPYEQLRISSGQLPKGIDRTRLENYLSPSDFETILGLTPAAFNRLPEWKRNDLKRKVDLA